MKKFLIAVAIVLGLSGVARATHCDYVQNVVEVEKYVVPTRTIEFVEVPNAYYVEKQIVQRNVVRRQVVRQRFVRQPVVVKRSVVIQRNVVRRPVVVRRQVIVEKNIVY